MYLHSLIILALVFAAFALHPNLEQISVKYNNLTRSASPKLALREKDIIMTKKRTLSLKEQFFSLFFPERADFASKSHELRFRTKESTNHPTTHSELTSSTLKQYTQSSSSTRQYLAEHQRNMFFRDGTDAFKMRRTPGLVAVAVKSEESGRNSEEYFDDQEVDELLNGSGRFPDLNDQVQEDWEADPLGELQRRESSNRFGPRADSIEEETRQKTKLIVERWLRQ